MSQASVKRELGEIKSQAKKMAVKHQSYITVKKPKKQLLRALYLALKISPLKECTYCILFCTLGPN